MNQKIRLQWIKVRHPLWRILANYITCATQGGCWAMTPFWKAFHWLVDLVKTRKRLHLKPDILEPLLKQRRKYIREVETVRQQSRRFKLTNQVGIRFKLNWITTWLNDRTVTTGCVTTLNYAKLGSDSVLPWQIQRPSVTSDFPFFPFFVLSSSLLLHFLSDCCFLLCSEQQRPKAPCWFRFKQLNDIFFFFTSHFPPWRLWCALRSDWTELSGRHLWFGLRRKVNEAIFSQVR